MAHLYEDPPNPTEELARGLCKAVGVATPSPGDLANLADVITALKSTVVAERIADVDAQVADYSDRLNKVIATVAPDGAPPARRTR